MRARRKTIAGACVGLMLAAGVGSSPLSAERLAVRRYTTADGLAGDYIIRATRDSRGFLWFATRDGLSRFDGVRFESYGMADGLPAATINHLLETRAGVYWVATNGGGLCRFNPQGRRREDLFVPYRVGNDLATNRVNVTYEDRKGRIWIGTDAGPFVVEAAGQAVTFAKVPIPDPPPQVTLHGVSSIGEDAEGSVWITGGFGLRRFLPDGRPVTYRLLPDHGRDFGAFVRADPAGRVWVGFRSGLLRLEPAPAASFGPSAAGSAPLVQTITRTSAPIRTLGEPGPASFSVERASWYDKTSGLFDEVVSTVYHRSDGHIWLGTSRGVAEFDGRSLIAYPAERGIPENNVSDIVEDSSGHLWVMSVAGATRVVRDGLVSYDQTDGLPNTRIHSLAETSDGRLFVVSGDFEISEFDGSRFASARPAALGTASCAWMSRCAILDHASGWWMPTATGLYHWPPVSRVSEFATRPPRIVYTRRNGLPAEHPYGVFEDRSGDLWVGFVSGQLATWQRAANQWREVTAADGLPPVDGRGVNAFADHPTAGLWIAFEQGGLVRRRERRFDRFGEADGVPAGMISALLADSRGRLWVATTQGGVARVDNPDADRPSFTTLTTANGLASDNTRCLVEDDRGFIFIGTSRGVDRLDPQSGSVKHFSRGEGLSSDFVTAALRDRQGRIWFGTISGLSRLDAQRDRLTPASSTAPPGVFIAGVNAGGARSPVSELGDVNPPPFVLAPDRNQVEIGFFGFSFDSGEPLRYQYRLEGADAGWSPPAETRTVNYASLAAGSYRFLVRAVRSDGVISTAPAVVAFSVLPPFYARWWFVSLLVAAAAALGLVLYRMRVAQLLRVERVRSRIATDLHDDIGASLSQIAILAEVARQRFGQGPAAPSAVEPLARIAETSRGLVDSMSDIVWAINPEVDTLSDLVRRMRRFVEDTLGSSDIEIKLSAPDPAQDVRLGADVRREVFLIVKESVTNVAKHAQATRVGIELACDRHQLRLRVSDDGGGFDPQAATDGNGVGSMRRRVASLGGHLDIDSAPGRGTTISFEIHL